MFPITEPTWIFFLVLLIILLVPLIFNKLRIPYLIGMILTGVLIGEHGVEILSRDMSFEVFGQVGMFYIMFLAGLEIDFEGMKRNLTKGVWFGILTATIPFVCGFIAGEHLLHYSLSASLLLACIFASHTLVSYPIVSRYGLQKHPAVIISITATLIALTGALLVLAAISHNYVGTSGSWFWLLFAGKCIIYFVGVIFFYPRIIRWFFSRNIDRIMQYIFVITMVFLAAVIADLCEIEGLLGAFLAGLIFSRFIPTTSPLMNRIQFVGNALFIPYFLVGVGMMVNLRPLLSDGRVMMVVVVMVIVSTVSKWLAAFLAQKLFHMTRWDRSMMFGLTEAHAAGAIAMVMVGTKIEVSPGVMLMNNAVLDGVVMMILFSCIISSMVTDRAAKMELQKPRPKHKAPSLSESEKIMVPVNDSDSINNLIHTAVMMRNKREKQGLICINVVNDVDSSEETINKSCEILRKANNVCVASDVPCHTQRRLAVNFANGVIHSFKENGASELIIGLHRPRHEGDKSLYGIFGNALIEGMNRQITMVKYTISLMTLRRIAMIIAKNAECEPGFYRWVERLARYTEEIGCRIDFFAPTAICNLIQQFNKTNHPSLRADYRELEQWGDFVRIRETLQSDHLLCMVMARPNTLSYNKAMSKLPQLVQNHFSTHSLMIIYPDQNYDRN